MIKKLLAFQSAGYFPIIVKGCKVKFSKSDC